MTNKIFKLCLYNIILSDFILGPRVRIYSQRRFIHVSIQTFDRRVIDRVIQIKNVISKLTDFILLCTGKNLI